MKREILLQEIEEYGTLSFARSGGPGGQNVNKVNTKVLLTVPLEALSSLTLHQKELVAQKLAARINGQGELFVHMQKERSQWLNRQLALEFLADLIGESIKKPKPRRKTKPTKASVERRLGQKKRRAETKKSRGRFSGTE